MVAQLILERIHHAWTADALRISEMVKIRRRKNIEHIILNGRKSDFQIHLTNFCSLGVFFGQYLVIYTTPTTLTNKCRHKIGG